MTTASQTGKGGVERFIAELSDCWQRLPSKIFFFGLLLAWFALFQFVGHCAFNFTKSPSIFSWMWGAYNAPALDSEHGKLIPAAVIILLWMKRGELLQVVGRVWWPGAIGLFAATALHVLGYAIQQPRLSLVALFCGIYSLMAMAWGFRFAKTCFFPFVLFVFSVPLGNTIQSITVPLRLFATTVTRVIAGVVGIPLIQQGTQLFDPAGGYGYEIVAACSGIRSLIPVIAITFIYAMLTFKSISKRLLLLGFAIPLAVVCNIFRVLAIVVARDVFSERAAMLVHEYFGFLTYGFTLAGAFLLGSYLMSRNPEERRGE